RTADLSCDLPAVVSDFARIDDRLRSANHTVYTNRSDDCYFPRISLDPRPYSSAAKASHSRLSIMRRELPGKPTQLPVLRRPVGSSRCAHDRYKACPELPRSAVDPLFTQRAIGTASWPDCLPGHRHRHVHRRGRAKVQQLHVRHPDPRWDIFHCSWLRLADRSHLSDAGRAAPCLPGLRSKIQGGMEVPT